MSYNGFDWKYFHRPFTKHNMLTSPYNWAEEITKKMKIPEKIELHDTLFRDAEQRTYFAPFNKNDYIDIAEAMSDWGMHRFEIMPAVSPENYEAAKAIGKMGLKIEMWAFCRARADDVELAKEVGCKGVLLELGARGYLDGTGRWKPEQMVKMVRDASKVAKDAGLRVILFYMGAATNSYEELAPFLQKTTEGLEYPDGYCPVDTNGWCTPEGTAFFTDVYRAERPDLWMDCHPHAYYNLGTANAITAVAHGCQGIEGEMLGFTLPALQEVAADLYYFYGMDLGIKWEKTREVCQLIADRTRTVIEVQKPFIGSRLEYGTQPGMGHHAALDRLKAAEEKLKRGEEVTARPPRWAMQALMGLKQYQTLGKQSGRWSINYRLWCMGIPEVSYPDECAKILEKVERHCVEKKVPEVSEEDFLKFYEEVVGHPAPSPEQRNIPEVMKRGLGPNWA